MLNGFGACTGRYQGGIVTNGNAQWDICTFWHWAYAPGEAAE
jgi:hypothetical protein